MSNSTFTLAQLAEAFGVSVDQVQLALYEGHHNLVDSVYGTGEPLYSKAAAEYLADCFVEDSTAKALETIRSDAEAEKKSYKARLVPPEADVIQAKLVN